MHTSLKLFHLSQLCHLLSNVDLLSKHWKDAKANFSKKFPGVLGHTSVTILNHLWLPLRQTACNSTTAKSCTRNPARWMTSPTLFCSVSTTMMIPHRKKANGPMAMTIPMKRTGELLELLEFLNVVLEGNLKVVLCRLLR